MSNKIANTEFEVIQGDITLLETDAIVNPANTFLMHTGGLAAAIVKRGGMIIQQELKTKHVIHAVGPRYKDGKSGEAEKLASAVNNALKVADVKKLKSIAIPAISSGIFGYPVEESAKIIVDTAIEYFNAKKKAKEETTIEKVVFCLLDENTTSIFKKSLESNFKKK